MSALLGLTLSIAILLFYAGWRRIRTPGYEAQMAPFGNLSGDGGPRTRYQRWVRPLALQLADHFSLLRGLTDPAQISEQLDYAGNPGGMTAHEFYGTQVYWMLAGFVVGFVWAFIGLPFGPPLIVLLPIAGFYYPRLWLRRLVRRRQRAITIALPDLLDMLAVCVTAGMGFDVALRLLTERGEEGPLREEMERLLRELSIGEPREEAFRHVIKRNSSEELRAFIDALLQTEELGSPIAATLERQASDMRINRHHRAREQGAKASNKLSLVLAMLIMPSVLCLILGGLVLSFSQSGGTTIFRP